MKINIFWFRRDLRIEEPHTSDYPKPIVDHDLAGKEPLKFIGQK
jgi:deoxyribodipyrimidine photolyase